VNAFDESEVATASFVEHVILMEAQMSGILDETSRRVCKRYGIEQAYTAPFIQTTILSQTYCLLVYPTEIFKDNRLLNKLIRFYSENEEIPNFFKEILNRNTLRHMRNAASHARIRFPEDGTVIFFDINRAGERIFEQKFSYTDIRLILMGFGHAIHNSGIIDDYRNLRTTP